MRWIAPARIRLVSAPFHLNHHQLVVLKELVRRMGEDVVDCGMRSPPALPAKRAALSMLTEELLARKIGDQILVPKPHCKPFLELSVGGGYSSVILPPRRLDSQSKSVGSGVRCRIGDMSESDLNNVDNQKDKPSEEQNHSKSKADFSPGIGMGVGMALGVAIGSVTDNLGLWLPVGLLLGYGSGLVFGDSK